MSGPVRRWLELRVRAPDDAEPVGLIADALLALGGRSTIELDGWLVTHVPEPENAAAFTEDARRMLTEVTGVPSLEVRVSWQDDEDWTEGWKRGLGPRRVSERLVVRPSWTELTEDPGDAHVIVLDPGMAFGTAEHGTTRGCLRLLDRVVGQGTRVLDVGAGSGILSIAAALLGAGEVVSLEGDETAWDTLVENVERNGVADRVALDRTWADPHVLKTHTALDGIVANIQTSVLRPMIPAFRDSLAPGGWLILSGILAEEWADMRGFVEGVGFRLREVDADDEWRSGLFRR